MENPYRYQTLHQRRIEQFMRLAQQALPENPGCPTSDVLELRARLIFEEAMETIHALGCSVVIPQYDDNLQVKFEDCVVHFDRFPDIVQIADGCADLSVVTIGTLSACGIKDEMLLLCVDKNNLDKFGAGHTIRADGKLVKPPNHQPPDILGVLTRMLK